MREPWDTHARLLEAAHRWNKAEQLYQQAMERRKEDVLEARRNGVSTAKIADVFDCSRQNIDRLVREGK